MPPETLIYDKPVNFRNIIKFVFPTVLMTMFTSAYGMVDGVIVSRFVGSVGLAAINIVVPLFFFVVGLSVVFATGGNAVVASRLGAGKPREANTFFSLILISAVSVTMVFSVFAIIFAKPLYLFLGADAQLLPYCIDYGNTIIALSAMIVMQYMFQIFLVTAGKPHFGLIIAVVTGCVNIALDVLFVAVFDWGIRGAAIATVIASTIGSLLPLFYFRSDRSLLRFCRPVWEAKELLRAVINGSSEMVNSLAIAFVTFLFNLQMMTYIGEKGVAAISSSLYIQDLFLSAIMGFSMGVGPVISFYYGAENTENLRKLFRFCIGVITVASLALFSCAELFAVPLVKVFAGSDVVLQKMALAGFRLFSIGFLFSSFNIFASGLFTSLCNGKISTVIAFLRAFIFQAGAILLLPLIIETNGIWLAVPLAEILTALMAFSLIQRYRNRYRYF